VLPNHLADLRFEMTKSIAIATFFSLILGLAMVGGAVYWQIWASNSSATNLDTNFSAGQPADRSYTLQELAQYDGKDGNKCLVAVDGDVYLIEGFSLWQNGEHIPSGGRARCGLDLSEVINESPHGRSKLQLLPKVGTLEQSTSESTSG
jgi:predicted heme/steroid binding protein